jgi:hypothetical protein
MEVWELGGVFSISGISGTTEIHVIGNYSNIE